MKHRSITGTILYTSRKPDRLDQPRGIEHFRFTHHTDGKRTLRAHCEIEEPHPSVLRDIVYSLDEHGRPMDCHVRLTVDDRFMGSGWFRFTQDFVECESYGPTIGRLSQRMPLNGPIDGMGTHPVVADGYLLSLFDWVEGEKKKLRVMLPSPDHRGATPPIIAEVNIDTVFLGRETVTVKAGTFATKHFQFIDDGSSGMAGQHPPYDVWITDDADAIMLQGGVGGYMQTWYELIALDR
ncbi:MAG: hypothetical protein INF03_07240 [Phenylobacterium sp.]|uniref:hypothetical protein n=1 Tax=Phenylobacterium sp. TaxID=1871053 RepID=UPI0025F0B966|nr:hypothetical protein [Phenylobacterium sp.]MCA3711190.1 hypothetical protein [Phenylobacterium sp.]MCA3729332.1 hypothetical protein [Phenylobacterium sp.]MCA3744781.1 hypothetical protein [Phenylobacterium sp.]MCA3751971.1 hypothetical protein [Phenylobacterium sp.]MCA6239041.1 hypothetical protein [Phenylobacterium sp.]